ncbi:MAG: DegT/DnrJ/EryC1/StrS family aminotransferase [Elusimicrobiota bacterium]|nr:DegT/DnrJ/EryC1/StrS family aminotransferase [Elusimicrobiota bacterium]
MRTPADLAATVYAPPPAAAPWRLAELYAPAAARFYRYGRHALADAFRAAGTGPVLLPGFFCREVLASADEPRLFYTVGPDLQPDLDSAEWPQARAVLAVDYFGFPCDLEPFRAYARRTGAAIIEDACHALFSRDEDGRLLGTRADFGALSPRKTLPLADGGVLLAPDPARVAALPPAPAAGGTGTTRSGLKAAARPLLAAAGARTARALLEALRAAKGFDWRDRLGREGSEDEALGDPAPGVALAGPIACGDEAGERSRRRALYELCAATAKELGLAPVFPSLPGGVVPYAFAFHAAPSAADAAYAAFRRLGLSVLPWPDLPAAVRAGAPAHYRDVYLAHFLW